jgi:hypothetical protein
MVIIQQIVNILIFNQINNKHHQIIIIVEMMEIIMDHRHLLLMEDLVHLNLIKLNILYDYLCINRSCFPSEDLYSFFFVFFLSSSRFFSVGNKWTYFIHLRFDSSFSVKWHAYLALYDNKCSDRFDRYGVKDFSFKKLVI